MTARFERKLLAGHWVYAGPGSTGTSLELRPAPLKARRSRGELAIHLGADETLAIVSPGAGDTLESVSGSWRLPGGGDQLELQMDSGDTRRFTILDLASDRLELEEVESTGTRPSQK